MTIGEELFIACLRKKNHKVLSAIQKKWLDGQELRQYSTIMGYYREHGEMMGVKAFCEKFSLDEAHSDSRPAYYLNQLKERYIFASMSDNIPRILKGVKEDPRGKLGEMQTLIASLAVDAVESRDVLYSDDTESREAAYLERTESKGVTYLSMGSEDLDKVLFGYRRQDLITIGGKAGQGKCLGKGTKVLMYDLSTKNVEDIVVGDKLMGPDGTPRNVLTISRGREQMYWIRQKKGMDYRVNESHILSLCYPKVTTKTHRENDKKIIDERNVEWDIKNISVRDYLKLSKGCTFRKHAKGYKSFGMDFPDTELPFDPYFLGVWLGDGTSRELTVTSFDLPIVKFLREYTESFGGCLSENPEGLWRMKGCRKLSLEMDKLHLLKRRGKPDSGFKHIPMEFIRTSREKRLQLLAGLLDTDGYMGFNSFEITLVSKRLSDDIKLLCRTLGLYVTQAEKVINGKTYYKCNIQGNTDVIPVRLGRKKAEKRKQVKNVLHTGIVVEKDIVDDYYGFTIDGDHLFCLEDFTVTHNTWSLVYLAYLLDKVLKGMPKESHYGDILFVSNEMGADEISERIDCINFRLPYEKFLSGTLTEREKSRYFRGLENMRKNPSRIRLLDGCQTIEELSTYMGLYQPSVVFIDGSYLMEGKMQEGWEKIVYITRNLKRLAKSFMIPIVNTTQLRRGSSKSGSKFALDGQDDFAYSSSYAQDSDIAIRMYQDADMKYHDVVGCEVVKGRRVKSGTTLIFQNDLDKMCQSITLSVEDDSSDSKTEEYVEA